ncbi:MAG: aldehyde dehydrogenase family protein, partial [Akkermansia sp.]|nr:aldehyde dehydrogenase family protein [Akkermansia sp.]
MHEIVENQRKFFLTHVTRDVDFRLRALRTLQKTIREWEPRISEALHADLGKSATEGYMCEIGLVLGSLRDTLSKLRKWSKPRRVMASLAHFPSTCRVEANPYGVVLIMSPWNYPVLLCLDPLIAALSAGNCCVVKPSSTTPATSAVLAEMLGSIFPPEYVKVVLGGRENCNALLEEKFDYIFFTGSPSVGHGIMEAAARHLTPVTLELGGKSPCILDASANVKVAARRIAFGKILNAGQTCVAPDYLLIHSSRKQEFVTEFREAVAEMLGEHPVQNDKLTHIITPRHFKRLMGLMEGVNPVVGGQGVEETLRIEPTLLDDVTRAALRSFQKANDLKPSGEPDSATLALLDSGMGVTCHQYLVEMKNVYSELPLLQQGSLGEAVIELQNALRSLGYFAGECDGVFGEATMAAVKRFQMANVLTETGTADRSTQIRLYEGVPMSWSVFLENAVAAFGDTGLNVRQLQRKLQELEE